MLSNPLATSRSNWWLLTAAHDELVDHVELQPVPGDAARVVEEQGCPVAAGIRLGVHKNTVRYRLRKMAEVTEMGALTVTMLNAVPYGIHTADLIETQPC